MAKLISQLQTALAYRLGETQASTNTTTLAIRRSWFKSGLEYILGGEKPYWFTEVTYTAIPSLVNTEEYSVPDGCRQIRMLKVNDLEYDKVSYEEYEATKLRINNSFVSFLAQDGIYCQKGEKFLIYPIPTTTTDSIVIDGYDDKVTEISAITESSTIIIPDNFADMLVCFAEARFWSVAHKRGKSSDAFAEYEQWLGKLNMENFRRSFGE